MVTTWVPYYIDYSVQNVAKTIGASKKRITFKFGIANFQAIEEGQVGANCRGSEHEVVFIWSLNSGRRVLSLDGKEVHVSESGQNGWTNDRTWQHVFTLTVRTVGNFKCHFISQPAPQGAAIRPFDLRINGVSIFRFNKIFQLGTANMQVRRHGGGAAHGAHGNDEPVSKEEAKLLAMARLESMKEYRKQQEKEAVEARSRSNTAPNLAMVPSTEESLISFDAMPSSVPNAATGGAMVTSPPPMPAQRGNRHVSSLTMESAFGGGSAYAMPPSQAPPSYGQQPYGGGGYQQPPAQQPYQPQQPGQPPSTALTPFQQPYTPTSQFALSPPPQPPKPSFDYASLDPYASPSASQQSANTMVQTNVQSSAIAPAPPASNPFSPQQTYGYQQPPQQQQQQQQQQQYYQQQPMQSPMSAGSMPSIGTYGSAPSFARPPTNQPPMQQQQQPPAQQQPYYNTGYNY